MSNQPPIEKSEEDGDTYYENMPPFCASDIPLWLSEVERFFEYAEIYKEPIRYFFVITALPENYKREMKEEFRKMSYLRPYTDLKKAIFNRWQKVSVNDLPRK